MNLIPGMSLRVTSEDEDIGVDDCQLGEFAYDYVEIKRHFSDTHASASGSGSGSSSSSTHEKTPTEIV